MMSISAFFFVFFFNDTATTEIYTLSLHDALPISRATRWPCGNNLAPHRRRRPSRSEEHTSELQSHSDLVCRLLLEKKKKHYNHQRPATKTTKTHKRTNNTKSS